MDESLNLILNVKVIAVVGLSKDESKPSNHVAKYLIEIGKEIIPINPKYDSIFSIKCYPSLLSLPREIAERVEMINVFRKSEDVLEVAKETIELKKKNNNGKPYLFWMQLGIRNEDAKKLLEKEGFIVIQDKCAKIEHQRLTALK